MRSQFLRHSLRTYAAQVIFTLFQALIAILSARLLGPENKGLYSLLSVTVMLAMILGRCGLGNALIYYCGRREPAAVVFNGLLLVGMISMGAALLALPIFSLCRNSLLRGVSTAGLIWAAAMIPVLFVFDYFQSAFIALMQMDRRNILFLIHPVLQLVFLAVTVGLLRWGLAGALGSLSVAMVIGIIWSGCIGSREIGGSRPQVDRTLMKSLLRFGLKSHVGGMMEVMNYRADFFLVNAFLGPAAVGFFSVAVNLAEVVWRLPEAVFLMLMPKVTRMDPVQAREFTPRVCRLILFPVLAICLGLLWLGRPLILFFFGSAFQPAVLPLAFLLPGCIAFSVWKILSGDLIAQGRPVAYSVTAAAAFLAMILLDLWLLPVAGIAGAAAAFSIAFLLAAVMIVIEYRRVNGVALNDLLVPKAGDFLLLREMLRHPA